MIKNALGAIAAITLALVLLFIVIAVKGAPDESMTHFRIIDGAKEEVRRLAKDPDSVKFRSAWIGRLTTSDGKGAIEVACGHFNAKNSFGAYTGYQRFIGSVGFAMTEEAAGDGLDGIWTQTCAPFEQN